ncbi:efflux RND transporter permease subunit [Vulgatibacter incomptus]|uniref:Cobalt-zinc-cadmium resistance protein CzcA n=1 Tax=Vulgatibacter incomptus TaxID=1391653 RepID=A0A0K1PJ59_9BACT|nr:CusA/CzcA family heavy metal efflux RND transporter [Vulgatibacter incomptus]AKU93139.1 Cobalt-zinc-cadmium resistance protein CzcA [Vulgatibacter incomptus]
MVATLVRAALAHRVPVLACLFFVAAAGAWALGQQNVDAYPDISAQMVEVVTTFPGRAPEEVERQVTIPIELALRTVPKVETLRSRTIFGLSVVSLIFEDGVDPWWARQRVQENLAGAELPEGATAELGPLATAYGEIFRYQLASDGTRDAMELRTLQDWVVIPRLLRVPGVAEVSNLGGDAKEIGVVFQPSQLQRFGLSVGDVIEAIQSNSGSAGGSVVNRGSFSFVVRGRGSIESAADLREIFLKSVGGTPVLLRDVATVEETAKLATGIFLKDDDDHAVEGIVLMRKGENPTQVLEGLHEAVAELGEGGLPEGVFLRPFYDRSELVQGTVHTVTHIVVTGITLVLLVLIFFLGRPSMALLVAATIPFALLFAIGMMYLTNIPLGLLSIGAIDFGIIADGAVIMAENIARRIGEAGRVPRRELIRHVLDAALEVESPLFLSMLLIVAAYLPLLTLEKIEGLLFRPMAMTMIFAVAGGLLFSLFAVPVLSTWILRNGYEEWENPLLRWFRPRYAAWVEALLRHRGKVAGLTVVAFAASMAVVLPRLGTEFLPYMDEGVIWVRANFPEGTSVEQSAAYGKRLRDLARELPEVDYVAVQVGRNDSGTDPFPPSRLEILIGPKPRAAWERFSTKHELVAAIGEKFRTEFPTTKFNFTQPIIDSVTEDTNGTSAHLALEISGADPATLLSLAQRATTVLASVPGASDVAIEQEGPQPQVVISADRARASRYGVKVAELTRMIDVAIGGEPLGVLYEGDRRFDITARFDRSALVSPEAIGQLPVHTESGGTVPLAQVATIEVVDGQTIVARENGQRRLTVRTDIVGRDQGSFVAEAKRRFEKEVELPAGYRVAWLGMFENLARAQRHFLLLIPATIGVIALVLLAAFRSLKTTLILLVPIPFAFAGGMIALYLRGMNLNVSTGVGLATVFAVSIMDGLLMVRGIDAWRLEGHSLDEAIVHGRMSRLRPILMTSAVAVLGLLPASLATGLGSDVQRPLATVIIWGLSSATLLTLFVVPVVYRILAPAGRGSERTIAAGQEAFD